MPEWWQEVDQPHSFADGFVRSTILTFFSMGNKLFGNVYQLGQMLALRAGQ